MATLAARQNAQFGSRIKVLRATIHSLLREAEIHSRPVEIDPEKGLDFYENVERFEAQLIETALEITGGRQNAAARLLNLRTSTLSWKIKKLAIKAK
jgi:DNA-binding NtrC family response regulator